MPNRILDCLDGRCASSELTSHEIRLLQKIEAGLRTCSRDYLTTDGLDRLYSPRAKGSRATPSHVPVSGSAPPPERSALTAFLERSARQRLRAG